MSLWTKFILWRYKRVGLLYGEMLSYLLIAGPAWGFNATEKKFRKLEAKIISLGFIPLPVDEFELVGGGYKEKLPEIVLWTKTEII